MLDILNQEEDSGPFRQPVNTSDVPNYVLVIDQPMDLQTVGEQLQDGNYATPNDFAEDVRLIFKNSRTFKKNRKSKMYAMTDRLSFLFEEYFHNILTSYETQKTAAGCKSCSTYLIPLAYNSNVFLGKSDSLHSKDTESANGKSLAPTNLKGIEMKASGYCEDSEDIHDILNRKAERWEGNVVRPLPRIVKRRSRYQQAQKPAKKWTIAP